MAGADSSDCRQTPSPLAQYEKLLAGGTAGAVAKTVTAPLDRVKMIYQVTWPRRTSAWPA